LFNSIFQILYSGRLYISFLCHIMVI